jgi:protein TonB
MKTKKSEKANLENKKGYFFLIGLLISLGTVLLAFEWRQPPPKPVELGTLSFVEPDVLYIPPTTNYEKPMPPKVVVPEIFKLVDNNSETEMDLNAFNTEPDESIIDFNQLVFKPKENQNDKEEEIFLFVEQMPEFPGGDIALRQYLASAVKYPVIAQENNIQGKVYVSFVIDETGNIASVDLLRGVDVSLDNEALRVVRSLPKWKPGKQGGKPVKVRFSVPIHFELQ